MQVGMQYAPNGAETLMTVFNFECFSASGLWAVDPPIWSTSALRFHNRLASSAFILPTDPVHTAWPNTHGFRSAGAVARGGLEGRLQSDCPTCHKQSKAYWQQLLSRVSNRDMLRPFKAAGGVCQLLHENSLRQNCNICANGQLATGCSPPNAQLLFKRTLPAHCIASCNFLPKSNLEKRVGGL